MNPMLEQDLESLKRQLDVVADDSPFQSLWQATLAWLGSADPRTFEELLESQRGERFHAIFAPFQRRHLALSEKAVAERLLEIEATGAPALAQLLDIPFARQAYERVAEALVLVDFSRCRRFVNIGCGPFPAAALLIHEQTSVPDIVAIDNDADAVSQATMVTGRLASSRLEIVRDDGRTYDFSQSDVIYIANHVFPKLQVLARIAETASCDTKVLVRDPCGLGVLLAERARGALPLRLGLVAEGAADANFHSRHLLCSLGAPV